MEMPQLYARSKKLGATSDVELAGSRDFQGQLMKRTPSAFEVEGRVVRPIANQIIAFLIFNHAPNTATQVVGIANRDTASLLREKIKTLLGFKDRVATIAQLRFDLIG